MLLFLFTAIDFFFDNLIFDQMYHLCNFLSYGC